MSYDPHSESELGLDVPFDIDDQPATGDAELADDAPSRARQVIRGRSVPADTQELIDRVIKLVGAARPRPFSVSAMINKDEVLELLDEASERLPDELREARWLRKERDEYLAKMRADGDEILDAARAHAERMVQRAEVVKAAEHRARRIIDGAEAEARRLRLECEDFCDQKLAGFEIVLERTLKLVSQGREKLQATNIRHDESDDEAASADEYFGQPRHE